MALSDVEKTLREKLRSLAGKRVRGTWPYTQGVREGTLVGYYLVRELRVNRGHPAFAVGAILEDTRETLLPKRWRVEDWWGDDAMAYPLVSSKVGKCEAVDAATVESVDAVLEKKQEEKMALSDIVDLKITLNPGDTLAIRGVREARARVPGALPYGDVRYVGVVDKLLDSATRFLAQLDLSRGTAADREEQRRLVRELSKSLGKVR